MINRKSFPKVLLFLAAFIFFSANTIYFLEADPHYLTRTFDTGYHFDFSKVKKGPYLNLKAAILINYDNGDVVYAKNVDKVRSIASLSKLVSAMVILDKKIDLNKIVKITKKDAYHSHRSHLRVGNKFTVYDLLHASLMNSDNRATKALARITSMTMENFAKEMNRKVKKMGLKKTVFFEPTGLDSRNVSTAREIAKILHHAYTYKLIREITSKRKCRLKIQNRRNAYLNLPNTNLLVLSPYKVLAGKTGYTIASDYCLTTIVKNKAGKRLTLVVLGVPRNRLRFREARHLLDWGFRKVS